MPKDLPTISPESLVDPLKARCPGSCSFPSLAQRVTLLSGVSVCVNCPAWRTETLARQIEADFMLRLPTKARRLEHLASREASFGKVYRERLHSTTMALWESRRAPAFEASE